MNEPLTLDFLLENACSNPEDFEHWQQWYLKHRSDDAMYDGWMRFRIELHCVAFIVVAKSSGDGTYEIRDYIMEDC